MTLVDEYSTSYKTNIRIAVHNSKLIYVWAVSCHIQTNSPKRGKKKNAQGLHSWVNSNADSAQKLVFSRTITPRVCSDILFSTLFLWSLIISLCFPLSDPVLLDRLQKHWS